MRHIRIFYTPSYKGDGTRDSYFYRYFKTIIDRLEECHWIVISDFLDGSSEMLDILEQFEEKGLDFHQETICDEYIEKEYRLYNYFFMKNYSRLANDDWGDLLCFKGNPTKFMEIVDSMTSMGLREYNWNWVNSISPKDLLEMQGVFKDVELLAYFYNVDGAYWGMMSNYHELIETVIQNVNQMKGIEIKEVDVSI